MPAHTRMQSAHINANMSFPAAASPRAAVERMRRRARANEEKREITESKQRREKGQMKMNRANSLLLHPSCLAFNG